MELKMKYSNPQPGNPSFILSTLYCFFLFLPACFITQCVLAQQPTITSFSPSKGAIGTTVIITGSNFNPAGVNNVVYFGAVKSVVLTATVNSLTVNVPPGATHQPISVTTNGLTAYSPKPFIVTFEGGSEVFSVSSFS